MYYIKINKLENESKQNDYFSKNDLYVKINILQNNKILTRKTQVIYNNNKPIWNEIFLLEIIPNEIEILLYEKGKFMDKLLNSGKIKTNNSIEKILYNNVELYHGAINIEDKENKDKLLKNISKLEKCNKIKDNTILKISNEKEELNNEINELKLFFNNKIDKLNNEYEILVSNLNEKIKMIEDIKNIINNNE